MKKRSLCAALAVLMLAATFACTHAEPVVTGDPDTTDIQSSAPDTDTAPEETAFVDEEPVFYTPAEKAPTDIENTDFSSLSWSKQISTANSLKNGIELKYTDAARSGIRFSNQNMIMNYHILQNDVMIVNSLSNKSGKPYFTNSMDTYIRFDDGSRYVSSQSLFSGRMNSQRMGYYYYDVAIRDQNFILPDSRKKYEEGEYSYDLLKEHGGDFTAFEAKNCKYDEETGILSYSVVALSDPSISVSGLSIDSEEFDAVQITLKTEVADIVRVLLMVDNDSVYSPDRELVCRFDAGEWTTVVIPFSAMNKYKGTVKTMKLGLGAAAKETVQIKEIRMLKRGGKNLPLLLERVYHTYSDKMYEKLRVVATSGYADLGYFGTVIEIPADTVRKMVIKNDGDELSEIPAGYDFSTLEYVGFDINGVGIYGIIMPADENGTVKVELKDGNYVITREIPIDVGLHQYDSKQLYHRIYTASSHQFNDLRKQAFIERNPLDDIQLIENGFNSRYMSYDSERGCYDVYLEPSGFVDAYYSTPDRQKCASIVVTGDKVVDRCIYLNCYTVSGALECAAVLDHEMSLLPIPVEVCKNFGGELEEAKYDKDDNSFGGEAFFPLYISADDIRQVNVLHLYQNWGEYPLKQLSSISFIQPYYHLSIGVTETNCIAPYFVFGKDGYTLPDFRANSAPLWRSQPQHTSGGCLYFLKYSTETNGTTYLSEQQKAEISSSGPVYADVNIEHLSDDESISVTYRHVELPQTDENRTYYEIRLKVLKDVTVKDFSKNFSLFSLNGRFGLYTKLGYLNENNEQVTEDIDLKRKKPRVVKLGDEYPYFDLFEPQFTVPGSEGTGAVNLACIIKDYHIVLGSEEQKNILAFRESVLQNLNHVCLTLDLDTVTLKAGDEISIDMILLPWGTKEMTNDDNVRGVREDSCVSPYKLDVKTGTAVNDTFVPTLIADSQTAEFTFSGGKNHGVVRVGGFKSYKKPDIFIMLDGEWIEFDVAGVNGYDGYQVYYDADGTYSFAFILDMDAASSYEIKVTQ